MICAVASTASNIRHKRRNVGKCYSSNLHISIMLCIITRQHRHWPHRIDIAVVAMCNQTDGRRFMSNETQRKKEMEWSWKMGRGQNLCFECKSNTLRYFFFVRVSRSFTVIRQCKACIIQTFQRVFRINCINLLWIWFNYFQNRIFFYFCNPIDSRTFGSKHFVIGETGSIIYKCVWLHAK